MKSKNLFQALSTQIGVLIGGSHENKTSYDWSEPRQTLTIWKAYLELAKSPDQLFVSPRIETKFDLEELRKAIDKFETLLEPFQIIKAAIDSFFKNEIQFADDYLAAEQHEKLIDALKVEFAYLRFGSKGGNAIALEHAVADIIELFELLTEPDKFLKQIEVKRKHFEIEFEALYSNCTRLIKAIEYVKPVAEEYLLMGESDLQNQDRLQRFFSQYCAHGKPEAAKKISNPLLEAFRRLTR